MRALIETAWVWVRFPVVILAIFSWSVLTVRIESLVLSLVLAAALCFRSVRRRPHRAYTAAAMILAVTFSPLSLTCRNVPGPPRIVTFCSRMQYYHERDPDEAEARGECVVASDLPWPERVS